MVGRAVAHASGRIVCRARLADISNHGTMRPCCLPSCQSEKVQRRELRDISNYRRTTARFVRTRAPSGAQSHGAVSSVNRYSSLLSTRRVRLWLRNPSTRDPRSRFRGILRTWDFWWCSRREFLQGITNLSGREAERAIRVHIFCRVVIRGVGSCYGGGCLKLLWQYRPVGSLNCAVKP
jgi:hypothetical protein